MPEYMVDSIESAYVSYVVMAGVSEELFWHADLSFLLTVIGDKAAYESWRAVERQYDMEQRQRR